MPHRRLTRIFGELKNLNLEDYPNAGAVLLRVFIELTVDYFLEHRVGWPYQQIDGSYLAQKLTGVANYLVNNSIMTEEQVSPIRRAVSGDTIIVATVRSMNLYVHSRHFSPIPSELTAVWDDFQPFIENVWRNV